MTKHSQHILPYLKAHLLSALLMVLVALVVDNILRLFALNIHPWKEAVFSGMAGFVFSCFFVPIIWRLGLVSLRQYLLAGIILFIPTTMISLAAKYYFSPLMINMTDIDIENTSQLWAIMIYIRIARSSLLFPFYIVAFWYCYHKVMQRKPF